MMHEVSITATLKSNDMHTFSKQCQAVGAYKPVDSKYTKKII